MNARRTLGRETRHRADPGLAAVEFALVLPVLVILLFGMVVAGTVYVDHLRVQSAAHDGARAGALVAGQGCTTALQRIASISGATATCTTPATCPGGTSSVDLRLTETVSIPILGSRIVHLGASSEFQCLA
jgi:Flp pilus assembly protein TadG